MRNANMTVKKLSNSLFNLYVEQMSDKYHVEHSSQSGHIRVLSFFVLQINSLGKKIKITLEINENKF